MIGPLPDQPCVHPDRGYDSTPTRDLLDELGYDHEIARKPIPAPIQAGKRWAVEHMSFPSNRGGFFIMVGCAGGGQAFDSWRWFRSR